MKLGEFQDVDPEVQKQREMERQQKEKEEEDRAAVIAVGSRWDRHAIVLPSVVTYADFVTSSFRVMNNFCVSALIPKCVLMNQNVFLM